MNLGNIKVMIFCVKNSTINWGKKTFGMLGLESGSAQWEARTLLLCYADPPLIFSSRFSSHPLVLDNDWSSVALPLTLLLRRP